ncbi:DUF2235 domain-containing protein [Bradyrhizobium ontarionense]|uniref:DUF2235 domain-containing protein n=1 Tax=Bradyrhizobium ontarionense TaxID=2898149 RepID=A0ABY3RLV2_9BRAD|nr:DUF2235 domain-containing protein [Bradyrhizobium sp. A19]UFZ08042.1 DUF2235 domain-containing protein [Bradyrhizobium sp. A19]
MTDPAAARRTNETSCDLPRRHLEYAEQQHERLRLKSPTSDTADQRVYYSQGVGTRRGEFCARRVTGWGIDDEIIEAYARLIQNFDDGDEIFIFGFSRGAYTARSLKCLI